MDSNRKPIDVGFVYVPDTSDPHWVRHRPGLTDSGWKLTCENGIATTFEVTSSDSKIPEAIGSVANAGVAWLAGREALDQLDIVKND